MVFEQKKNDVGLVEYDRLEKDIGLLDEQISPVKFKYYKALELSVIKMVLSAPSARVGARPAAEVGSWVSSQKSAGQNEHEASELSEVEKLKAKIEMKK